MPVAEPTCDTKVRKVRVQRDKELEDALFDGEEEMAQKRLERDKEIEGKLFRGSWVGQVGPVDSCAQVGDLSLYLVNSRNLSWVGQVRPVDSCGQVRNYQPVRVKMTSLHRAQILP